MMTKEELNYILYLYFNKWKDEGERCDPQWIADDLTNFIINNTD